MEAGRVPDDEDDPREGIPTKSEVKSHPGNSGSEFSKRHEESQNRPGSRPDREDRGGSKERG